MGDARAHRLWKLLHATMPCLLFPALLPDCRPETAGFPPGTWDGVQFLGHPPPCTASEPPRDSSSLVENIL
jgi:hypothetical protein